MKLRLTLTQIVAFIFIIISCKKENHPPDILDQTFSVKENSTPGLVCATIAASDPDGDHLTYSLSEENPSFPFEIDPAIGNIKIKSTANLDFELIQQYKFQVKVTDGRHSISAFVTINIVDQLEVPNVIDQSFAINENTEGVYSIGSIKFVSKGQNEEFNFSIVDGNTSNLFFIGEKSGELFLTKGEKLNYESAKSYTLQIKIQNKATPELYTITKVSVNVGDVNEKPTINDQSFSILENSPNSTEIGYVKAYDIDANQSLIYGIVQSSVNNAVNIETSTGKLFVTDKSKIDYEATKKITLAIKVTDNGTGALSDTANVTLNILDVNENPTVTTSKLYVDENCAMGKEVGKVVANSYEGAAIEYTIVAGDGSGKFAINKNTGMVSVAQSGVLNYETKSNYSLTIKVNEVANTVLATNAVITIALNDVNESPVMLDQQFTIGDSENVGAVVGRIAASDPDSGQALTYSITAGNSAGYFSVDSSSGDIILAQPIIMNGLDEMDFVLSTQVKDNGTNQLSATANMTIKVSKMTFPGNGMIAYYPFNNNAIDESTNTYDGNVVGPTITEDRKGKTNSAYSFDGNNDYIDLGPKVGDGIRSISLWFRLDRNIDSSTINANTLVAREGDPNNVSEFIWGFIPSGWPGTEGKLRFIYFKNSSDYYYIQSNSASWQKDIWHHVVMIIHPAEGMKMYIDKVKQADTNTFNEATANNVINTFIGSNSTYNRFFSGKIDDVIFYNRALTEAEVNELYHQ